MAFGLEQLQTYCDPAKLKAHEPTRDVFLFDGVDPYRSEGITSQFLKDARVYHERYFKPNHFGFILQRVFDQEAFPIRSRADVAVLDLGSGSGNTAIPLLNLNPTLKLVATDLSLDLLLILAELVRDQSCRDQIGFVCADANRKTFHDGVFDVVVGAAILHHLLQPAEAVAHALGYLKPGGLAVFFEPFEYGCNMMKNLYHLILDDPRCAAEVPPELVAHFQAVVLDYNARFDVDRVKPYTHLLDDKWLFTRRFFSDLCHRTGCRLAGTLNNLQDHLEQAYTHQLLQTLKLGGLDGQKLPAWCLELCREFDRAVSPELKSTLVLDGTVIVRK